MVGEYPSRWNMDPETGEESYEGDSIAVSDGDGGPGDDGGNGQALLLDDRQYLQASGPFRPREGEKPHDDGYYYRTIRGSPVRFEAGEDTDKAIGRAINMRTDSTTGTPDAREFAEKWKDVAESMGRHGVDFKDYSLTGDTYQFYQENKEWVRDNFTWNAGTKQWRVNFSGNPDGVATMMYDLARKEYDAMSGRLDRAYKDPESVIPKDLVELVDDIAASWYKKDGLEGAIRHTIRNLRKPKGIGEEEWNTAVTGRIESKFSGKAVAESGMERLEKTMYEEAKAAGRDVMEYISGRIDEMGAGALAGLDRPAAEIAKERKRWEAAAPDLASQDEAWKEPTDPGAPSPPRRAIMLDGKDAWVVGFRKSDGGDWIPTKADDLPEAPYYKKALNGMGREVDEDGFYINVRTSEGIPMQRVYHYDSFMIKKVNEAKSKMAMIKGQVDDLLKVGDSIRADRKSWDDDGEDTW